jgi:hypothetical protein
MGNKNKITEDYVSLELAHILKSKGFDVITHMFYNEYYNNALMVNINGLKNTSSDSFISAPTHQMVIQWIWKNLGMWISIRHGLKYFVFNIYDSNHGTRYIADTEEHKKIHNVTESAIKYVLTNMI